MKNSISIFICPSLILREVNHLFICLRKFCISFSICSYCLPIFLLRFWVFFPYQFLGALYMFRGFVLFLWHELQFICPVLICLLALLCKFFVCFLFCIWCGCGCFAVEDFHYCAVKFISVFLLLSWFRKALSSPRLKRNSHFSCSKLTVFYFAYKSSIHLEFILMDSVKFRWLFILPDDYSAISSGESIFAVSSRKDDNRK